MSEKIEMYFLLLTGVLLMKTYNFNYFYLDEFLSGAYLTDIELMNLNNLALESLFPHIYVFESCN